MDLTIPRLLSGGLITNYFCTSRCGHCAYFSSPSREKDYITAETAKNVLGHVKEKGCRSLHIGGGEPLLRPKPLMDVLDVFRETGMSVDYIETNSSWFRTVEDAGPLLRELKSRGATTLLISISPFHNEYIPLRKITGLLTACRSTGMNIFPWVESFLPDLKKFDPDTVHSLEEYEELFGDNYVASIPGRYWISFRGRALKTYKKYMEDRSFETIVKHSPGGCGELFDVSHFHVDLYGNYVPGLCTGLSISSKDLGGPLSDKKYPFITRLMDEGIEGLASFATREYGYVLKETYVSKCDICYDIRKFLVIDKGIESGDLKPKGYYLEK